METASLKAFAIKARTDLIKAVSARAGVVLAENSLARLESVRSVQALEKAIENDGLEQVIDRVAYTWFNRIIALRFMDANGYTSISIVSPAAGKVSGQPEVLAEAKAGSFDSEVVSQKTQDLITSLLNGSRQSQDPQGEAYGLLLEAYCQNLNKVMPFMFEREGDYTELLLPPALLSEGSVRDRAVATLTSEICSEVEVIGWLYQFYISERKDEVFEGFKKNKKAGADEIPAATQLFTPHWIVRYLVENSLGRLWLLNNPSSKLVEKMDYYIQPIDKETEFLKINKPEELKIIDPAVGSGHMLTYAFDLLHEIYSEKGYDPAEIPGLILEHNLFGTEIDPRAGALAAFALTMKAVAKRKLFLKKAVQPNICVLEKIDFDQFELDYLWEITRTNAISRTEADEFWQSFAYADVLGTLVQAKTRLVIEFQSVIDEISPSSDLLYRNTISKAYQVLKQASFLVEEYSAVVANPPYMGKRNMESQLSSYLGIKFPEASDDLYLCFFIRGFELLKQNGFMAQVAMRGWLHSSAQIDFRKLLLGNNTLEALMPMGNKVMPIDFETAAVVWRRGRNKLQKQIVVTDVVRSDLSSEELLTKKRFVELIKSGPPSNDYLKNDSAEILFDLDQHEIIALTNRVPLVNTACKVGLQTGDVQKFVRFWHEVSFKDIKETPQDSKRWAPYAKAGGVRRWYGYTDYVVNWENNGELIKSNPSARPQGIDNYWRAGVEWSDIGHHDIAARLRPEGYIFDVVAMSLFDETNDHDRLLGLLAYLNSSVAGNLMNSLSSGLHYSVGYVAKLPEPGIIPSHVIDAAKNNVSIAASNWNNKETSRLYAGSPIVNLAKTNISQKSHRLFDLFELRVKTDKEDQNTLNSNDELIDNFFLEEFGAKSEVKPDRRAETEIVVEAKELSIDYISFAIGCMFGRYCLEASGLVLANQEDTLSDFFSEVPDPIFKPDEDNVIPIVDGDWFEDDIVSQFRQFLRASFGEEHFEENLQFITAALGVNDIRDYFVKSFYADHVKRYKKRPIYWLFSSPKGSFNALIYLHRYTPSTASTVLTGYLREYIGKLEANLEHLGRVSAGIGGATPREKAAAEKESDRILKVLVELREYERDVLFPLAGKQINLDLDDGVLVNYQKLGPALKDIGLKKVTSDE